MNKVIINKINEYKRLLNKISSSSILLNPINIYNVKSQILNLEKVKLMNAFNEMVSDKKLELYKYKNNYIITNPKVLYEKYINKIENNINKLELLNPLNALKRGYGIVKKDKKTIENIKNIKINDTINISLSGGIVDAVVTDVKEEL